MTDEELDAAVGGLIAVVIITAYRNSEVGFQGCVPTDPCHWSPDRYGVSSRKHEASVKPNRRGGVRQAHGPGVDADPTAGG